MYLEIIFQFEWEMHSQSNSEQFGPFCKAFVSEVERRLTGSLSASKSAVSLYKECGVRKSLTDEEPSKLTFECINLIFVGHVLSLTVLWVSIILDQCR